MRRQDEVLGLYPRVDAAFRTLLLDLAGDLTPVHDSDAVDRLLGGAGDSPDEWTRAIAMASRASFGACWVPARLRLAAPVAGTWSVLHRIGAANDVPGRDDPPTERQALLQRAFLFALEPAARELATAVERGAAGGRDGTGVAACLALARLPLRSVVDALQRRLDATGNPVCGIALGACGTASAHAALLAHLARPGRLPFPQVALGLRDVLTGPEPAHRAQAAALLDTLVVSGRENQLAAAAMALAGSPDLANSLARRIARAAGTPTVAHLLIGLARAGAGLPDAMRLHDDSSAPLLRTLAVRAAGRAPGSGEFLISIAERGEGNAQALAIELLAQRDEPRLPDALLDKLLESRHWRVRLNAALVMAARDPERAFAPLLSLLTSSEDLQRASGAFALAYLQDAEGILIHLLDDRSALVRAEAVTSLARHRGGAPVRALARVALDPDPARAHQALLALAWSSGEGVAEAIVQLARAAPERPDPRWRAQLYRTMGSLAAGAMLQPAQVFDRGLAATDPAEVTGCLDGLLIAGVPLRGDLALAPEVRDHPDVRAKLAEVRLLAGDVAAAQDLAGLLAAGDPARGAARAVLAELAQLAPWLGRCPRLDALERSLTPMLALRQPQFEAFTARELDAAPPRAGAAMPVEQEPPAPEPGRPVARLPKRAMAVVDLPRPEDRSTGRLRTGYYTPLAPDWRPRVLAAAAALVALALLGVALPRSPRGAQPGRGTPSPADLRARLTASPAPSDGPRSIGAGDAFEIRQGRGSLLGPYPGARVELAPGKLVLLACSRRPERRLGCDLEVRLEPGTYHVDARPGSSSIAIEIAEARLAATGAQFSLEVRPDARKLSVERGRVALSAPASRTVTAGESFTF